MIPFDSASDDIPRSDEIRALVRDVWDLRMAKLRKSIYLMVREQELHALVSSSTCPPLCHCLLNTACQARHRNICNIREGASLLCWMVFVDIFTYLLVPERVLTWLDNSFLFAKTANLNVFYFWWCCPSFLSILPPGKQPNSYGAEHCAAIPHRSTGSFEYTSKPQYSHFTNHWLHALRIPWNNANWIF